MAALVTAIVASLGARVAVAEEPIDVPHDEVRFQGSFYGLTLEGAPVLRVGGDGTGFAAGLNGRVAVPTQLFDLELGYTFSNLASQGPDPAITRHSMTFSVNSHPGFMFVLYNDRFNWIVAGFHGILGLSADHITRKGAGFDDSGLGGGWHVGFGFDIPLSSLDAPEGWWITLAPRWRFIWFGERDKERQVKDLVVLIGLAWRNYDTNFARIPRPF